MNTGPFDRDVRCLLGIPLDAVDEEDVLAAIRLALAEERQFFISTPNTNSLVACRTDSAFRDSFLRSDLCIADGMPLVWMARTLGLPIRERVAGSSLFESLRAGGAGPISVFFFGGPEGAALAAEASINAAPGPMRCVGHHYPGFVSIDEMSTPDIIHTINAAAPDFVLVALGFKKGQSWIERNRHLLNARLIIHLGAVVNFAAGTLKRAPPIFQRLGLEWLWRIKEEPALWRRYYADARALLTMVLTRLVPLLIAGRFRKPADPSRAPRLIAQVTATRVRVELSGEWVNADLQPLRVLLNDPKASNIEVDLSGVASIDSAFIGLLMVLYGRQSNRGLGFRVCLVPPFIARAFNQHCAEFLVVEPLSEVQTNVTA